MDFSSKQKDFCQRRTRFFGVKCPSVYERAIQSRYPRVIKYTVDLGVACFGVFIGTRTFSFPVFYLVLHVKKGIDARHCV